MNIISRTGTQIVTLEEAKHNSRVTTTAEDSNFDLWLDIAHEHVEDFTNTVLEQSQCENITYSDEFNLNAPVRGLISVTTVDNDGVETDTTDYTLTKTHDFGLKIKLDSCPENYAYVRYVAGFGDYSVSGAEVGINTGTIQAYSQLKSAILLLTNHFYENRGIVSDFSKYELPFSIKNLMYSKKKYL